MHLLCGSMYWFPGLLLHVSDRLSVVSNNIQGEGLVALSQSMKTNPTLSNVYIWGNKFDEATCAVSFFFSSFTKGFSWGLLYSIGHLQVALEIIPKCSKTLQF